MHEMSLMQGVLDTAQKVLADYQVKRVNELTVSAGVLANLLPDAFDYAFVALSQGTMFEGAQADRGEKAADRLLPGLRQGL